MPLNPYKQGLVAQAHALRQAGWSQTEIGREMGVPRETICKWLKIQIGQNDHHAQSGQNDLANTPPARYLLVPGSVEKFRAPPGVSFSLIIADPPWNVSDPGHSRARKARPNRPFTKDFGAWDSFESKAVYLRKAKQWLEALHAAAAPNAFLFFWCSYRYISHILQLAKAVGWGEKTLYTWAKSNPMPLFGNNNFLAAVEQALILTKGDPRFQFKRRQPVNFFSSPQVGGQERLKNRADGGAANLAQKPMTLTKLWVLWASRPGEWVLDAFAGTGTTTIAALQLGRNAGAVEADPLLIAHIQARVKQECQNAQSFG